MDLVDSLNTKELEKGEVAFDIAVVHEYLWTEGMGFPGSPEQFHINVVQKNLDGYDAAFFGDNHHFFHTQFDVGCPHVMNVGTFMRRRSTERGYSPRYGIIYDNGHVASKRFHTRSDVMIDTTPKVSLPNDITVKSLLEYLKAVDSEDMDFRSTLIAHIKKPTTRISERAKQIIFAILEEC